MSVDAPAGTAAGQARGQRPRRAVAASALVGAAVGLVCVAFVVRSMASQWTEVREQVAGASWGWIAAALAFAAAGMTWIAGGWRRALALSGPVPRRRRAVAWYYAGEIGKYVPGGVWPVLGRGELARRGGVPRARAYPSVALSLAALYPPVLTWARGHAARLTGRAEDIVVPPWGATVRLVASYVPAWLFIWAATWCTARALVPDPPVLRTGIATTLSWTAGFAAVPVPAGAGVREAVFVAASGLPAGLGATVAVGSRLAFLVVDVAGVVLTAPWHRRASAGAEAP